MEKSCEVAVIGGGIIGCSIAYHLAKEKVNTALLESGTIGGKATNAAAGMLGAHSECDDMEVFFPFARNSQLAYRKYAKDLREISGIDIRLTTGGIIKLAYTKEELKEQSTLLLLPSVEPLSLSEIKDRIPDINNAVIGGVYIADDVHVHPLQTCRAFARSSMRLGAHIYENTPVVDIKKEGTGFLIRTPSGDIKASYVVIAAGIWSGKFLEAAGISHRMTPVKGQCMAVRGEGMVLDQTLFHKHSYVVPRSDGTLVIGATMEEDDWSESPTVGGITQITQLAEKFFRNPRDMKVDAIWTGLRPATFDKKPYIGFHPENRKIIFATGHFRNGILLAPATGKMVSRMILGKEIKKEWLEAFKVDRLLNLV
ncbi:glycine oxidase ThiO [Bacillus massilinigeriensis]|uniref:glycine oxidase ThiO n=1 Tax=Bacillus mediterraneensis TaxID=1805474 RepID=UPI0008F95069|nr:glycine oxidase ThiO [Bacillus mediterraneensis]